MLGGVEMALLAFIEGTTEVNHLVFTADAKGPAAARWREAGAVVLEVPGWAGFLGFGWLGRWRRTLKAHSVTHLIIWSPTRLPWVLAPIQTGTRVLVHLGTAGTFGWKTRIVYSIASFLLRPRCKPKLIMCSARVAESLAHEHLLAGLPSTVILNAVQLAYFSVRRIEYPAPRHWGMVARLDALKDHATLIKAAALIVKRFPDFRLTIVGEGLSRPYIEQLVRDHDLSDVVTLVGVANKPWELMKGWEGAIFSTGPKEGFGIAAAEAMAMGLPCVFTDLPAIREVGGAAVLYAQAGSPESLAEQVGQLISNPDYAYRLGQAAAFRAQKFFSPSSFAAAYLRNFDS